MDGIVPLALGVVVLLWLFSSVGFDLPEKLASWAESRRPLTVEERERAPEILAELQRARREQEARNPWSRRLPQLGQAVKTRHEVAIWYPGRIGRGRIPMGSAGTVKRHGDRIGTYILDVPEGVTDELPMDAFAPVNWTPGRGYED